MSINFDANSKKPIIDGLRFGFETTQNNLKIKYVCRRVSSKVLASTLLCCYKNTCDIFHNIQSNKNLTLPEPLVFQ